MDNQLFISFKEELYKEAKRLVPIVYKKNDFNQKKLVLKILILNSHKKIQKH